MHIGSEEDAPLVEFVVMKKENLRSNNPKKTSRSLSGFGAPLCPLTSVKTNPGAF
jgi:hypothetical protein